LLEDRRIWFQLQAEAGILPFLQLPHRLWHLKQPRIQRYQELSELRWPGHEANHTTTFGAEFTNSWIYFVPKPPYAFMID